MSAKVCGGLNALRGIYELENADADPDALRIDLHDFACNGARRAAAGFGDSAAFTTKFSTAKNPVFSRNLAVRR